MTRFGTGILGTLALTLLGPACAESDSSLVILYNKEPDRAVGSCGVSATEGSFVSEGVLDLVGGKGYTLTPLIKNNAASVTGSPTVHAVSLRGANSHIEAGLSPASETVVAGLTGERSQLFSGYVPPGGTAALPYRVIDDDLAAQLAERVTAGSSVQIVVVTKVIGTVDGGDISSNSFRYPITLCRCCLVPGEPDPDVCEAFQYQDEGYDSPTPDAAPPDAEPPDAEPVDAGP